ncbi:quinol:cytochrome C oxidoreductase [uncultured Roseivirga sp.]|uniref:quinol:cytochrome C oxidoreductase n=1 Tax=uncultured Roseivirga sp. TaxID=543088 RepID=UPI0030D6FAEE|tara:strand:+ start:108249 stop:109670 length:1422 start_codon:yes stop_codon:yes gene_type:complete
MAKERFEFTTGLKKKLYIVAIIGFVLLLVGAIFPGGGHEAEAGDHEGTEQHDAPSSGDHETNASEDHNGDNNDAHGGMISDDSGDGHEAGEADHGGGWLKRLGVNLWINNVYFAGLAIIGIFFFTLQYASQAGWSAFLLRVPLAMGSWLPYAFLLMIGTFMIFGHDIFHWTHSDLYNEFLPSGELNPHYDALIAGKSSYFFLPLEGGSFPLFFILRMVLFFGVWFWLFKKIKSLALAEDELGGDSYWFKIRKFSAIFLVFFAVSSSVSAWDWIMSIDVHWFSTMFGWYVFASWWVTGLAFITLVTILLKEAGYLSQVTANHLHDLGKFIFAFSIFWTYVWFSQFLLIYYANIPEESVYFVERLLSDKYAPFFFINLGLNFIFPLLTFMTRDAKRLNVFLKIVCIVILGGHWIDFYLMVTPGTLGENGAFGLTEIGLFLVFGVAFVFVTLTALSKSALVAKNHPMLEEAKHHHI